MHDAVLNCRLGVDALNGFREAFESIHTGDNNIFHAAIVKVL